ncbi:MAG: serine/threonine-protein kinase, partial [Planctomycetota bacterium]
MIRPQGEPPSGGRGNLDLQGFGFDLSDERLLDRLREAEAPIPLGSIGPYELLEEVSRGGQGVVYKALQPGTGRQIAVKRLLAGSFATPSMRRRFEREMEAASSLDHPAIVSVFGMEIADGEPLLAMEWIEGVPITRWRGSSARRPQRQMVQVFLDTCDAVHHAHQRGVLHRDLKPSNILIDEARHPHVLDFGLAKILEPDASDPSSVTSTGQFLGTPAYAAPEQILAQQDRIDIRSDVYSLGVILHEMLTGQLPFEARTLPERIRALEHGDVTPPPQTLARVARDLRSILLKALSPELQLRYASVDALAADLRRWLRGEPIEAERWSGLQAYLRLLRRHRLAAAFLATVFLLVTVFGAIFFQLSRKAQQ